MKEKPQERKAKGKKKSDGFDFVYFNVDMG